MKKHFYRLALSLPVAILGYVPVRIITEQFFSSWISKAMATISELILLNVYWYKLEKRDIRRITRTADNAID